MSDTEQIEILPDTFPLGDEGPSQSEIDTLKSKHGKVNACFTGGKVFIVKMMNREDHTKLQNEIFERTEANDPTLDVDLMIAQNYSVWPGKIDWDKEPGGAVPVVSQEVSKLSGFIKDKESIEL